ncbi:c-type cytochrome [Mesorhizobium kowhaii]|jgi:cytochrome c553|uniref:c-type cytochrome n=1 Tax=Mesorhizobium kowhaii TaxID=1300272 RepID=UPI0035ED3019
MIKKLTRHVRAHSMRGLILGLAALVVTSSFVQAAGDSIAGQKVMTQCQVCHGKDGIGKLSYTPNISGQKYEYLVHSLMAYKIGQRKSQMMSAVVKNLSDEDIANVAAYYAAIKITVEAPQ